MLYSKFRRDIFLLAVFVLLLSGPVFAHSTAVLRLSLACKLPACDTHCGISTDYITRLYNGNASSFLFTSTDTMIRGIEVSRVIGRFKDIDLNNIKLDDTKFTLKCRGWSPKNESGDGIDGVHACFQTTEPTGIGDEEHMVDIRKSAVVINFCDRSTARNAKIAIEIIATGAR